MKLSVCTGFTIAISLSGTSEADSKNNLAADNKSFSPDIWIRLDKNNAITVSIAASEMGQGVLTSLTMLVAEEMEADWGQVRAVHAKADPAYGYQATGGSKSMRNNWEKLRMAGAAARQVLLEAAAKKWDINISQCRAQKGKVVRIDNAEQVSFGELVDFTQDIPLPQSVNLKTHDQFRIIGKSVPRIDTPIKVNGSALFGADIQIEGILTAIVVHPPVFGAQLGAIDSTESIKVEGVQHVIPINEGVAIVASDFWSAKKGMGLLKVNWSDQAAEKENSQSINKKFQHALTLEGEVHRNDGNALNVINDSQNVISVQYEAPFQAHATLEPMTCTAHVHDGMCEVWVPTQAQTKSQRVAAKQSRSVFKHMIYRGLKLENDDITINTTMIGGGFGRRLKTDFVSEAVQISRAVNAPIRLIWTREEDIQHDFYRPASLHKISAAVDNDGKPIAWHHAAAGSDIDMYGARDMPYDIKNVYVEKNPVDLAIPTGPWRSVNHSYNAFVIESFIDELAMVNNFDPLQYRIELLKDKPDYITVLEKAAEKAGWGKPLPDGHFHGIAVYKCFGTYVAQVAEISIDESNKIIPHRITAAINCGLVVNPDTVISQLESAIAFGLSAALKGEITIRDGHVEQSNFHDFPILRFDEMPEVDVVFVKNNKNSPEGVGEPGVPPVAPAIGNAIYAATKKRCRVLPFKVNS
jgi:isoquinoline 1-oxidoreductase beta subunit